MKSFSSIELNEAGALMRGGGVLAYPTEAVYGLGCDPFNEAAVLKMFALKQRDPGQGFLLIAATAEQLEPFVDWAALSAARGREVRASWPGPITWVLPRSSTAPRLVTGAHEGIAVRVTDHSIAAALCRAFDGAIVSTSANLHGMRPAVSAKEVRAQFSELHLDAIVEGDVGQLLRPTPIHDGLTGRVLRH